MKFFSYTQNNSGGTYYGPLFVVVQAKDNDHADNLVTGFTGVYFDGCSTGSDCSCCGDRWSRSYSDGCDNVADVYTGSDYGKGHADAPLAVNAVGDVLPFSDVSDDFWV